MEIDKLFGIPAHPLIVHGVVVLLPLAAIFALIAAAVPKLRRHWAPIALGLAVVSVGLVILSEGSGEQLERRVAETEAVEEHTEAAELVMPWALGLVLVAAGITAADRLGSKSEKLSPKAVTGAAVALAVLVGAGATASVISVGHSGAKSVWEKTGNSTPRPEGEGGETEEGDEKGE